jgi:hypothetical protein
MQHTNAAGVWHCEAWPPPDPGAKSPASGSWWQATGSSQACDMEEFAPEPGVYVLCARSPGGDEPRLRQWTPMYLGKASEESVGKRCTSYLDMRSRMFWGDSSRRRTRSCAEQQQLGGELTCKCRLFKGLVDRGFDVGIL